MASVATWDEVVRAAPELADAVTASMNMHKHKVLATLRADGSPRVTGTELEFVLGEAWLGSMTGARKVADLRRDGRVAIHNAPDDAELAGGDAKLSGIAIEVDDPATKQAFLDARGHDRGDVPEAFHLYRIDVTEIVHTSMGDPADHLVIRSWRTGRGETRIERH